MVAGERERRLNALDYALYCIVNNKDRGEHFSALQDMYLELQEENEGFLQEGERNNENTILGVS